MDISKLVLSERMVEILHPVTELPIGIRLTLVHLDDPSLKKLKRSIADKAARLAQRGKIVKSEEDEDDFYELCFQSIKGWEWYNPTGQKGDKDFDEKAQPDYNGDKAPVFSKKLLLEIFEKQSWFVKQVSKEIQLEANFLPH